METNILYLKPSDIAKAGAACVEARENFAVFGPPGCGKSSIMAQIAEMTGRDFLVSLPALEDPTEPGGLPWISQDHSHAKKVMFAQAYKALNTKVATLWLLEDFTQSEPAVQKAYMQWAQAREIDGQRLPDHVSIAIAGNRREDKAGVTGMLEPIKGRFTLLHMVSDVDDFCNNLFDRGKTYGLDDETISLGVAFIRFRKELLNKFEPTADFTNSPTERNWVSVFRHTMMKMPAHIEHALVSGRVGAGAATEFLSFLRMQRSTPSLDAILMDVEKAVIPDEISQLYAVSVGLAGKATAQNFGRIARYAERLEKARNGEFAVLLIRDAVRRTPALASTSTFNEVMGRDLGKLVTGME